MIVLNSTLQLERVRISRDSYGKEPGWLLEKMVIFIPETNEEYVFQCNRWIDRNEPEFEIAPSMLKKPSYLYKNDFIS